MDGGGPEVRLPAAALAPLPTDEYGFPL